MDCCISLSDGPITTDLLVVIWVARDRQTMVLLDVCIGCHSYSSLEREKYQIGG